MARPQNFDRREVVEKAMNLFWLKGYNSVSVQDIAEAMEINRSSFYNTFVDKETIFNEVMQLYKTQMPCLALEQIRVGDPVLPTIREIFYQICSPKSADQPKGCLLIDSVAADLHNSQSDMGREVADQMKSRLDLYRVAFKNAIEQGELDDSKSPDELAMYVMSNLVGLMSLSKIFPDEKVLRSIADQTLLVLEKQKVME
jgi:TetR/AcrR family transcriptional regulator, transcriptional repressor for nem operon